MLAAGRDTEQALHSSTSEGRATLHMKYDEMKLKKVGIINKEDGVAVVTGMDALCSARSEAESSVRFSLEPLQVSYRGGKHIKTEALSHRHQGRDNV